MITNTDNILGLFIFRYIFRMNVDYVTNKNHIIIDKFH
jgi:hypothetical protein